MNVRAERLLWDTIPADRWLSHRELRQILIADGRVADHWGTGGFADQAIGWLLDGGWISHRLAPGQRRDSRTRPKFEYHKNPLNVVPHEIEIKRVAGELAQQHAQAKSDLDAQIDRRIRELGVATTAKAA